MTASQYHPYLSPEAYLEAEKDSPIKHEYFWLQSPELAIERVQRRVVSG